MDEFESHQFSINMIVSFVFIVFFYVVIRFFIHGHRYNKFQKIIVLLFSGVLTIGATTFAGGMRYFANPAEVEFDFNLFFSKFPVLLFLIFIVVILKEDAKAVHQSFKYNTNGPFRLILFSLGSLCLLVFAMNLAGGITNQVKTGAIFHSIEAIYKEDITNELLTGDASAYWNAVARGAPEDFNRMVDQLMRLNGTNPEPEDVFTFVEDITNQYMMELSEYGLNLTDRQRKEMIRSVATSIEAVVDDKELCILTVPGAVPKLYREDIEPIVNILSEQHAVLVSNLIQARDKGKKPIGGTGQAIEYDWSTFYDLIIESGVSEEEFHAFHTLDVSHPELCQTSIVFFYTASVMEGAAGQRVRMELIQALLGKAVPDGVDS